MWLLFAYHVFSDNYELSYAFCIPLSLWIHDSSLLECLGGGPLKLYNDQKLCWHFGIHDGDRGQCTSPDVFVNFLGLLDSIPYSDIRTESSESFGYKLPNFRYLSFLLNGKTFLIFTYYLICVVML